MGGMGGTGYNMKIGGTGEIYRILKFTPFSANNIFVSYATFLSHSTISGCSSLGRGGWGLIIGSYSVGGRNELKTGSKVLLIKGSVTEPLYTCLAINLGSLVYSIEWRLFKLKPEKYYCSSSRTP